MMKMHSLRFFVLSLLLGAGLLFAPRPTHANPSGATFTVNSTLDEPDAVPGDGACASTPSEVCTLRAAIQEANSFVEADTILLPAGTYLLTRAGTDDISAFGDLDIFTSMSIVGDGADSTIIDANKVVTNDRVFHFHDQNGIGNVEYTLSGLTIQNGIAVYGGGILLEGTTLTLDQVIVQNNTAFNSILEARGGGIENAEGYLTLNQSVVRFNETRCEPSCYTIGGGIDSLINGTVILMDSTLQENAVTDIGGGMFNAGTLLMFNSTFQGNSSDYSGGGLYHNFGTANVVNSTFSGNHANEQGGAIYLYQGNIYLYNSTITQNRGDFDQNNAGFTGGIYAGYTGMPFLYNTILAQNYANVDTFADCKGTVTSGGYNLIGTTTDCTIMGDTTGDLYGISAGLGALADNGGPTMTHALLSDSLAIDAGNPTGCVDQTQSFDLDTDQRGEPRPLDGGSGSARCDIGAYEFNPAQPPQPFTVFLPFAHR